MLSRPAYALSAGWFAGDVAAGYLISQYQAYVYTAISTGPILPTKIEVYMP